MSQLSDFFEAIKTTLLANISANNLRCEYLELEHSDPSKKLPLPLILIGAGTMEQVDELDEPDALTFDIPLEAHCILPSAECNDVHALNFATQVLAVLNRNSFGLDYVTEARDLEIQPGDFTNLKNGYESRVVVWRQMVTLDLGLATEGLPWLEAVGDTVLTGNTEPVHTQTIALEQ